MSFSLTRGSGTQVTFHVRYKGKRNPTDVHVLLLDPKNPSIDHAQRLTGYDRIPAGFNPQQGFDIPYSTNPPAFPFEHGKLAKGIYTFALTWSFGDQQSDETDPDQITLIQPPLKDGAASDIPPGCTCTVTQANAVTPTLSYDQSKQELTVELGVDTRFFVGQSAQPTTVSVAVGAKWSIYHFVGDAWEQIHAGDHVQPLTFPCGSGLTAYQTKDFESTNLAAGDLRGKNLVLLLKCQCEITGDIQAGPKNSFTVCRRVGATLDVTVDPPKFKSDVRGGAWGAGTFTDSDWISAVKDPTTP
jgi:hypothetical protein